MPVVTVGLPAMPSALPIATTASPTCRVSELPSCTVGSPVRSILTTARSWVRSSPTHPAGTESPSLNVTTSCVAALVGLRVRDVRVGDDDSVRRDDEAGTGARLAVDRLGMRRSRRCARPRARPWRGSRGCRPAWRARSTAAPATPASGARCDDGGRAVIVDRGDDTARDARHRRARRSARQTSAIDADSRSRGWLAEAAEPGGRRVEGRLRCVVRLPRAGAVFLRRGRRRRVPAPITVRTILIHGSFPHRTLPRRRSRRSSTHACESRQQPRSTRFPHVAESSLNEEYETGSPNEFLHFSRDMNRLQPQNVNQGNQKAVRCVEVEVTVDETPESTRGCSTRGAAASARPSSSPPTEPVSRPRSACARRARSGPSASSTRSCNRIEHGVWGGASERERRRILRRRRDLASTTCKPDATLSASPRPNISTSSRPAT